MGLFGYKAMAHWALLCWIVAVFQVPVYAQQIENPEDRLISIKQALVDLALGNEIKLASAAYIDSNGVLHESSLLTSNAQVRAVRVREYLQEAGVPVTKLDADMLPIGHCSNAKPNIKRQALIRVIADSHTAANGPVGDHYLRELAELAQQVLMAVMANSEHWAVSVERRYANGYESYVSGTSLDNSPYRFDIALTPDRPLPRAINHGEIVSRPSLELGHKLIALTSKAVPETLRPQPWPREKLTYELQLYNRVTDRPLWHAAVALAYPRVPRGYAKSAVPDGFQRELAAKTRQLVAEVTERTSCEVNQYRLSPIAANSQRGQINGGLVAGIQVGDQFLISAGPDLINQALVPRSLEMLVLAEVVSVSAHTAILQRLAGSQLFEGGNSRPVALLF